MKKKKTLQILVGIVVIFLVLIIGRINVNAAIEYNGGHIYNPDEGGGPLEIPGIGLTYCAEHGGSFHTLGDRYERKFYTGGTTILSPSQAYMFSKLGQAGIQRYIWNSGFSHNNDNKAPSLKEADNKIIEESKEFTKNAEKGAKLIASPQKAKYKNCIYNISPINIDYDCLGSEGKISSIEIYNAETGKLIESSSNGSAKSNTDFTLKLAGEDYKKVKKVRIKVNLQGMKYTGSVTSYTAVIIDKETGEPPKGVDPQDVVSVHVKQEVIEDSVEFTVKLGIPQLVTTKYIKSIKAEDGRSLWSVSDNMKPKVTVDTSVEVKQSGRYSLKKQDTTDFNLTYGDIITYVIKVYNVGSLEADMDDEDLRSTNSDGGNIIVKNGYIYDYPNEYLELVNEGGIWSGGSSEYKTKATNLGATILSYEEALDEGKGSDDSAWSKKIEIKFKVKGKEKEDHIKLKNNGNTTNRKDKAVKFLKSATTKNKDGDEVKTEFAQPEVKVNTSSDVNANDRFIINMNAPDLTVMDGDTIEYCMRYYSIGLNSTVINYKVEDKWGEGLELESVKTQDGENVEIEKTGSKIIISPPTKNGKKIKLSGVGNSGVVTNVPYYDVYIKFKVKINREYVMEQTGGEKTYVPLLENKAKNTVNVAGGFEIKGKVFIDNLDAEGKVTQNRNSILDGTDKLVEGIKVELLEADGITPVKKIENPATGEEYPTVVYTNGSGEYKFPYLRVSKINILSPDGSVEGNIENLNKYCVRFSYNGQEYENVTYAVGEGKNSSYATEFNQSTYNSLGRAEFNDQFEIIDTNNSEKYSLMKEENKVAQVEGETNSSPAAMGEFKINAYSGKDNKRTVSAKEHYKDYLNLGLVKREFDLELKNRLDSMDITINGVSQQVFSINGGTISETISEQEVYFQESDYYAAANNGSPITSADDELSVWVNYTVTVTNKSPDNFIGILKQLDFYCDARFDKLVVDGKEYTDFTSGSGGFTSKMEIPIDGKELDNTADNGSQDIIIKLHLSRETIWKVLTTNSFRTLETVAEIGSYKTKYNGDIFGNEHGVGSPNAGKIDEDSNAGNFELNKYLAIRTSTNPQEIFEFFNKEDDCRRSLGIKLMTNGEPGKPNQRKITGIVFEDATTHNKNENTRTSNGIYEGKDKLISGVVVQVTENGEVVPVFDSNSKTWTDLSNNVTYENGSYVIEGYIPSRNYQIQFTYGNETQKTYNAQDYKSTIDVTKQQYLPPVEVNNKSPNGSQYYWYSDSSLENKSVAKDDDTKMEEATLDYTKATSLENGINCENTAKTAMFYAPIRQYGNQNTTSENYTIGNMTLGLAERPRSELTINKVVDHINITTSDGRVLIDGSKGAINSTSWTDRYVQAIIDENLIYGSIVKITYKYLITNTGEVDYVSSGNVTYGNNGINVPNTRQYYDYGKIGSQNQVTTQASTIIDYIDNGLRYDEDELANPETDASTTNNSYWKVANDNQIENLLDINSKDYSKTINTKLIANSEDKLLAGETGEPIYLTLSKVLATDVDEDQNSLTYNNYVEIIEQTNSAGRRSYHTTKTPNKDISEKYTTQAVYYSNNKNRIETYEFNRIEKKGNNENILLSDVVNRGTPVDMEKGGNQIVLSIPGDLGNPTELETTLYWEPDSDIDLAGGSVQIIPPFGNQKIIWIAIITTSAITLAGGIYLIKKKVL